MRIPMILFLLFSGFFAGCARQSGILDDFQASASDQSYYMPLLDIYVVRGGTQDFKLPVGEPSAETFLKEKVFADTRASVNYGMKQAGIFYPQSAIRVFYISGAGLPTTNYTDLINYLSAQASFSLVSEAGVSTGSTVTVDFTRQRVFFLKYSLENGVAGLSRVGYPNCFQNASCQAALTTLIFSSPFNGVTFFYSSILDLSNTVIHEFGHYYGLFHNFDQSQGINLSCYYEPQASTLRYMDYYNQPEYFISCEKLITQYNAALLAGSKTPYRSSWEMDSSFAENVSFTIDYLDQNPRTIWKDDPGTSQ